MAVVAAAAVERVVGWVAVASMVHSLCRLNDQYTPLLVLRHAPPPHWPCCTGCLSGST
jgi:hypothetical protein